MSHLYNVKVLALELISITYSAPATDKEPPKLSVVNPVIGSLLVSKYSLKRAAPLLPIFIPNLNT